MPYKFEVVKMFGDAREYFVWTEEPGGLLRASRLAGEGGSTLVSARHVMGISNLDDKRFTELTKAWSKEAREAAIAARHSKGAKPTSSGGNAPRNAREEAQKRKWDSDETARVEHNKEIDTVAHEGKKGHGEDDIDVGKAKEHLVNGVSMAQSEKDALGAAFDAAAGAGWKTLTKEPFGPGSDFNGVGFKSDVAFGRSITVTPPNQVANGHNEPNVIISGASGSGVEGYGYRGPVSGLSKALPNIKWDYQFNMSARHERQPWKRVFTSG